MFSFFKKSPFVGGSGFLPTMQNSLSFGTISIICIIIFFLIISIIYYYKVLAPKMKPSYRANQELGPKGSASYGNGNGNGNGKEAELMLFYVDWCPHCKTAKPEWENLKQEYQGKTINGYSLLFTEINCTNESPEVEKMIHTYKIEGYPTIKLIKDGQVIEYDAKPTKATLVQFLNSVL